MKASVYYESDDFRYEEIEKPTIGDNEVLLKIKACGVCGTDVQKANNQTVPAKTVLGHEYAGVIVEKGTNVKNFNIGDRVIGGVHVPCFSCHYCKRNHHTLCEKFRETQLIPGGFSEYLKLTEEFVKHALYKIPDNISFNHASLVEPIACCIKGQKVANIHPNDNVLIMGSGQIGVIHGQLLKQKNVKNVIISDVSNYKLSKAKQLGINHTINITTNDLLKNVDEITEGQGVDVVIIAAGISSLLQDAMNLVRKGGKIICFSPFDAKSNIEIDASRFFKDEISIIGTYSVTPFEFEEAIIHIQNELILAETMITHKMK